MRLAAVMVVAVACSPNYAVPDGHRRIDAPPGQGSAADAPPDVDNPPPPLGLLPLPPGPGQFMWPSLQEQFARFGTQCTGQVTLAVGDRAVCFVGTDDDVHCAGAVYTRDFGPMFMPIGEPGVDQITISATWNSPTGNAICIHRRAGTVACMGDANHFGLFGNGTTSPSTSFVQFGSSTALVRMGQNWDVRCVLDATGNIDCAGYGIGSTPAKQTGTNHQSFWTRSDGVLMVDDPMVFRQANGSRCVIEADGLHCPDVAPTTSVGAPGMVVDGFDSNGSRACWLEATGIARCTDFGSTWQVFASAPPLVAIAGTFYSDSRCGVGNDGSLWCIGTNMHGELGTGTTSPVTTETRVAPPGMVKVTCN